MWYDESRNEELDVRALDTRKVDAKRPGWMGKCGQRRRRGCKRVRKDEKSDY